MTHQHGDPADRTPSVPGFELRRLLGRGAHAEVWLATDLAGARSVALKLAIPAGGAPSAAAADMAGDCASEAAGEAAAEGTVEAAHEAAAEGLAALAREVALLRRIDHPHIVRLLRVVGVGGGGLAAVLEYAPGGSLADLVAARGRLEPAEVTTLLIPLGRALAHLHERGLVHGDLSPGNVLFAADGRPLLADLGVARVLGLRSGGEWGTPGFADPAHPGPDPAGDVRALGALGWFALTGSPPAPGDGDQRVGGSAGSRDAGVAGPAGAGPGVSPRLLQLLRSCLAQDHSARPTAAEVVRGAWAAVPPVPIRLLAWVGHSPEGGEAESSATDITRRVRAAATEERPDGGALRPRRRGAGRLRGGGGRARPTGGGDAGARGRAAAPLGAGSRTWRSRPARLAVAIMAVGLLAAGGLVVGGGWPGGPAPRPATGPSSADPAPADPAEGLQTVVGRLAHGRALAFATASARSLLAVDEPGSPAMAADTALVQRLLDQGIRLEGLGFMVAEVRTVARGPGTVTVLVTVATSAHRQVRRDHAVVRSVPAAGYRRVRLVLVRAAGDRAPAGWWVRAVQAVV